jgi:CubicO group peptidase (beta-lactamase class C family)
MNQRAVALLVLASIGVLSGILAFPDVASAQTDDRILRSDLQRVLAEESLAGAAWATVRPGGSIRTGAVGYRDRAARLHFSDTTRFHVGSLAKAVLATGILRLVTENRISLDDPVSRYLPMLHIRNPWEPAHPVTIRHLLDHTSGLDDARLSQIFSGTVSPDAPLSAAFSRSKQAPRVRVRPGSRLSYSNSGYTLLGMVVEAVTNGRYEDYLDAHLLEPLGMRNSTSRFTTQEGSSADSGLAWGHLDDGTRYAATPIALRPAGQFTTTAHDLAVFARFLMGDGTIEGLPFIRADLMRARGHPSTTEASRAGLNAGYALGLGRRDRYGTVGYCHNGNIVGFVALLCTYPGEGKAFVIAVNTDSETARYERVFEVLARHLSVGPASTPPTGIPARNVDEWEGFYVPSPSRLQSAAYLDATLGFLRVTQRNESLILAPVQGASRKLRPVGGYLFAAQDRTTTSHVLLRNDGAFRISDGFTTYQKVSPYYLGILWISLALGLLGILWFVAAGFVALARFRSSAWRRPEMIPFGGVMALLASLPLLLTQSFSQLGDMTVASVFLWVASVTLPFTMIVLLWRAARSPRWTGGRIAHACWAIAVLQWCAVLTTWDLLPLRLWS